MILKFGRIAQAYDWFRQARRAGLFVAVLSLLASGPAFADGPHIAFHGTQGPYTVTLFSAPDPLVAGPVELTLLVQNAADGSLARGVSAGVELGLPGQSPVPYGMEQGALGANLFHTTAACKTPGRYTLVVWVAAPGAKKIRFGGTLPVDTNHGQRNMVLWAVFMPALLVVLFLANQHAKQHLRRGGKRAAS